MAKTSRAPLFVSIVGDRPFLVDCGGLAFNLASEKVLQSLADCVNEGRRLRIALHDAISRPMGVIPDSAMGLTDSDELAKAQGRYNQMVRKTPKTQYPGSP